jgi:hypothetical protein
LCRLTSSAPLIASFDATLAPFVTPLHTGRLGLCVGGSICEPERDRQSQKGKHFSPRDQFPFHFFDHFEPPVWRLPLRICNFC